MKRETTTTTKIIEESEQNIFIFFQMIIRQEFVCQRKYVDVLVDFRIRELTDLIARFE